MAGLVWTFWGLRALRSWLFPLILLASVIPLPAIVYNQLAAPLQLLASTASVRALQGVGVAAFQDGNIINLAGASLGVEEACSGLRSMSALAVLALLMGYMRKDSLPKRLMPFVLAFPIAILINILRVVGTAFFVEHGNLEFAMGFYHSFAGWLVFLTGFALIWLVTKTMDLVFTPPLEEAG